MSVHVQAGFSTPLIGEALRQKENPARRSGVILLFAHNDMVLLGECHFETGCEGQVLAVCCFSGPDIKPVTMPRAGNAPLPINRDVGQGREHMRAFSAIGMKPVIDSDDIDRFSFQLDGKRQFVGESIGHAQVDLVRLIGVAGI